MKLIKIDKKDIFWSYSSQVLQIGSSVLLLPIILKELNQEFLGIWYVFLTFSSLVNLLDFGIQPSVSRSVSYIFSGATSLKSEGIEEKSQNNINYKLLKTLISSIKLLYSVLSIFIGIIMLFLGTNYFKSIELTKETFEIVIISWRVYTLATIIDYYYYYYTPLLFGSGKIKESHKTIVMSKILFLVVSTIGLMNGYSLISLAMGRLMGGIINRITSHYYFYTPEFKNKTSRIFITIKEKVEMLKILKKNSLRSGVASIGGFLAHKGNIILVTYYMNIKLVGSFGLTYQIVGFLMGISILYFNAHIPLLNSYRINNEKKKIREVYAQSLFLGVIIYITGSLFIFFLGNFTLIFLKSKTLLLEPKQLMIVLTIFLLEYNHSIAASLISTKNIIPFTEAAILSGVGIFTSSLLLIKYTDLGIYSILISQGVVQLLYNNWKWPLEVYRDLDLSLRKTWSLGYEKFFLSLKEFLNK